MPLLLVSRIKAVNSLPKVELSSGLYKKYPMVFGLIDGGYKVQVRVYVDRFYNESGDVVEEYKQLYMLPLEKDVVSYYADLTRFHVVGGVPVGYFISVLLITFVVESKEGTFEIPIFPNEFIVEKEAGLPSKLSAALVTERRALQQVGRDVEVVGLLYKAGLGGVAIDLVEAVKRFYTSDYEGAIKFFRKVIEGLRNYVQSNRLEGMSDRRQELLREYLSKAYQLISNFGEHSGTYGFMPEAVLSKDIAVSSCRYVVTYLMRG